MQRELLGDVAPGRGRDANNLAFVQYDRGDTRGARAPSANHWTIYRQLFPGDHPDVARIVNQIGFWLTEAGDYAEADQRPARGAGDATPVIR